MKADETLFQRLSEYVPPELKTHYWKRMAHLRKVHPDDEILYICEAMGLLTLITSEVPNRLERILERIQEGQGRVEIVAVAPKASAAEPSKMRKMFPKLAKLYDSIGATFSRIAAAAKFIWNHRFTWLFTMLITGLFTGYYICYTWNPILSFLSGVQIYISDVGSTVTINVESKYPSLVARKTEYGAILIYSKPESE